MRNLILQPAMNFSSIFDGFFDDFPVHSQASACRPKGLSPAVDIRDTADEISLTFELPGMKKDEIKVTINDGILTVSGERRGDTEEKLTNYVHRELRSGSFERSFTLPDYVRTETVKADYNQGLLTVSLAKEEKAKLKQIDVSVG